MAEFTEKDLTDFVSYLKMRSKSRVNKQLKGVVTDADIANFRQGARA